MKLCKSCQQGFEVTAADRQFYDRVSPVFAGKKYAIPEPTLCPDCRQQRRLSFCNERFLYPGTCGLCGKKTLTQFPPHLNQPQYCRECWHSDRWDPLAYGADFDFSRPFFQQIDQLRRRTPALMLCQQGELINSEYIHYAGSSKNCYLIMHADYCEDCYYGYGFKKNVSCVDGFYNLHCERCYDCVDVHQSYGLIACQDSTGCHSSAFLRDCIGCKDCFLCVGLRQKQYCFENQQLTKAHYEAKMAEIDLSSYAHYQRYQKSFQELQNQHTFKEYQGHNLQNSLGDHLMNCKEAYVCFDCEDVENARYCYQCVLGAKNIMDIYQYGSNLQESYECSICGENAYHLLFCIDCHMNCSDLFYCWYMERSKDCFGCVDMQAARYCILNKQYTKEKYIQMVAQIVEHMQRTGEWGEFFPAQISLFGYNKTTAQMYYPLTGQEALARGFKWDDYELPPPEVKKVIPAARLPDNTNDIPDDVLNWAIQCEATGKRFKLTPQELRFYREMKVPIPRRHPDQRHMDRFMRRNPRRFYSRSCTICQKPIQTTYAPERPERVACEGCYMKTMY